MANLANLTVTNGSLRAYSRLALLACIAMRLLESGRS